jgi:NAD(P)-dependent dehydrogenase (short-subunit alcohol dehydrogenase family)
VRTDVTSKASIEAAVQATVAHFGRVDILVNNAFIPTPNVLLEEKTDEMLELTLTSALWATWWAMRAVMPHMREHRWGRIVNFYSIDTETGAWLHADYNTAKSGIVGLTRSAASEWGRFNITVNAIAPTAMGATFFKLAAENPGFAERSAAARPLGRSGDPEQDIGPAVVSIFGDVTLHHWRDTTRRRRATFAWIQLQAATRAGTRILNRCAGFRRGKQISPRVAVGGRTQRSRARDVASANVLGRPGGLFPAPGRLALLGKCRCPSRASAEAKTGSSSGFWRTNISSRDQSPDSATTRLLAAMASGPLAPTAAASCSALSRAPPASVRRLARPSS